MYVGMMDILKKRNSMYLQDDLIAWDAHKRTRDWGKLFIFDKNETTSHHIFFDDNAKPQDPTNIDIRDVMSGETIAWKKALGRYIVRADPLKAVGESDYFVKRIEEVEGNLDLHVSLVWGNERCRVD